MDAQPVQAAPEPERQALEEAIKLAGSEHKLAGMIGYSQVAINKAKHRGYASPAMAVAIDKALAPKVTKSDLLPAMWPPEPERAVA